MSTTIDQKVVEMRFDNKHFESNVSTTMSTLDKLKQSLKLTDASKGLDNLGAAAKKVDMSGLSNSVETVRSRFSALEVMGVTALANITNSAVNAGKRIVSALTIDPVKTGFNEYELKMDSVKTIMASTGESVETVNRYLEELNTYSDKTIYSFSDMTQNIGKFTNAGVKLEDAVLAIQGISNEAAVSGANANEASRAMYNFSQALSAGYVKLIDWKSIENANMATVEFKNELIKTAVELGTLTKQGDMYVTTTTDLNGKTSEAFSATKNFNEALANQWMTSDVLIKTLGRYADETTDIGKKAFAAAQDVTKFSQVFDILKETAQSGWAKTWEIVFGNINEAKAIFTPMTNVLSGFLESMADIRNSLLGGALNLKDPWFDILGKLDNSGLMVMVETVEEATDKLKKFQEVVDKVWMGDYKNSDTGRYELLEKAGYDSRVVQDLVNKGRDYELTIEDVEESHKKFGLTMDETAGKTELAAYSIGELSEEQLRNAGLTEGEIRIYKALAKEAERTGVSIGTLVDEMSKNDGRTLLIDALKNAWSGIVTILKSVKSAWEETFEPVTIVQLYKVIKGINEFSKKLIVSDETADKMTRTFNGLFAVLDLVRIVIGGPLSIALKIVSKILGAFGLNIWDITAILGDAIVKVRDFVDSFFDIPSIMKKIIPPLKNVLVAIRDWIDGMREADNIPKYILKGLVNGLIGGAKAVGDAIWNLGVMILKTIKDVLGIHSPSVEFFKIGKNIIEGLINGIKSGFSAVFGTLKGFGSKLIEIAKQINWSEVFVGGLLSGSLVTLYKFVTVLAALTDPLENLGDMFEGVGVMLKRVGTGFKAMGKGIKHYLNGKAMLSMAFAIGILAASVYVLTKVDTGKLWGAIGALTALAALILLLSFVASKINSAGDFGINPKAVLSLMAVSGALLLLAIAMTKLTNIKGSDVPTVLGVLAGMILGMMAIMAVCKGSSFVKMGGTLLALSASLIILIGVIKLVSGLSIGEIVKGLVAITAMELLFGGIIAISKLGEKQKGFKSGGTLLTMALALLVMTGVIKQIAKLDEKSIIKGLVVIAGIELLLMGIVAVSKLNKGQTGFKTGGLLLQMSLALLVITVVIKQLAKMDEKSILKGLVVITTLELLFMGLIAVSKVAGKNAAKAGTMLLAMSGALLILTGVMYILSLLEPEGLFKGLIVITVIGLVFAELIKATRGSRKCVGALIAVSIILALLVAVVAAMSYMDPTSLYGPMAAISILMLSLSALVKSLGKLKNTKKLWGALLPLIAIMATMGLVLAMMSALDTDDALENALGLSVVLVAVSSSLAIMSKARSITKTAKSGLIYMAGAMVVMGLVLAMMSALKTHDAIVNAIGLGIVMNTMASSLVIMGKVGSVSKSAKTALIYMSGAMVIMGLVLTMMSALKTEDAIVNAISLGILMNTMASALVIMGKVGSVSKSAMTAVIYMSGALVVMGLVLAMMSALKTENAIVNAIALSILMNAMTSALVIMSNARSVSKSAMTALLVMSGAMVIMGLVLAMMSALKTENAIVNAIALSILMNAMASALLIVSNVRTVSTMALISLAVMSGVMALLGLVLAMMTALNVTNAIPNAMALSVLLMAMTASLAVLSLMGGFSSGALMGVAVLALMAGVMALLGLVLAMMTALNVTNAMETAMALSLLLLTMTGVLAVLTLIGLAGPAAFIGIAALATLIVGLGAIIAGIGALVTEFPQLEEFLNKGIPLLEKIGNALGSFLGNIVGGFLTGMTDSLPKVAENLCSFAEKLRPFIISMSTIPKDIGSTLGALAKGLLAITGAELVASFASWFTGDSSVTKFAEELPKLGVGLKGFSDKVRCTDVKAVTAAATAAKSLAEMTKSIPNSGGVAAWFAGENSISKFAGELPILGSGIKGFSDRVAGINPEAVTTAANAAKSLTEMTKSIPNSGGVAAWFAGENSVSMFAAELPKLGSGIKGFADRVSGINPDAVTAAATAAKSLTEMTKSIPNSGGVASWFAGENSISQFAGELISLGIGIKGFADRVAGVNPEAVIAAASAAKSLAAMTAVIPNSGGVAAWFAGDNSITSFASELPKLGGGIKGFADKVAGINPDAVTAAANAAVSLAKLTNSVPKNAEKLVGFGDSVASFGGKLKTYFDAISGVSSTMINASSQMLTAINKIGSVDTSNIKSVSKAVDSVVKSLKSIPSMTKSSTTEIASALKKLGETSTDKLLKEFNSLPDDMKKAGEKAIKAFASGIKAKRSDATNEAEKVATKSANELDDAYGDFKDAGAYVASGFAKGIKKDAYKAVNAAIAMVEATIKAIEDTAGINSPAKETIERGRYTGEGYVLGIQEYTDAAGDAGAEVADSAIDSMSTGLDDFADAAESSASSGGFLDGLLAGISGGLTSAIDGLDSLLDLEPTITPVVDLTNVETGADAISSMLGEGVGIDSYLGAVDTVDPSTGQNGGNDDVVDAIEHLEASMSGTSGDTYNINGVTYSGDSEIADAVRIIVRAAKIERRS